MLHTGHVQEPDDSHVYPSSTVLSFKKKGDCDLRPFVQPTATYNIKQKFVDDMWVLNSDSVIGIVTTLSCDYFNSILEI